ncbi:hypothetical protein B0H13DRAFT_2340997 [Mycena leptocephala]|nr:hypothetical protein B0H13DRAFT_2340997 [Mycena leptocephala]
MAAVDNIIWARDRRLNNSLSLVGLGKLHLFVLLYDHCLTLGNEVAYIWRPGHARASAWFLVIRYFSLCANIAMLFRGFVNFTRELASSDNIPPSSARSIRLAAAWEAEFICDLLVLVLTLYRAFRKTSRVHVVPGPLWRVMTRDSAMYFGVICIANLANILMFYFGDNNKLQIHTSGALAWFTAQISVVMISRLMLNLHAAASPDYETKSFSIQLDTLDFASNELED